MVKAKFVFTLNNELQIIHIMFVICDSVPAGEHYRVNTTECNIRYYVIIVAHYATRLLCI